MKVCKQRVIRLNRDSTDFLQGKAMILAATCENSRSLLRLLVDSKKYCNKLREAQ